MFVIEPDELSVTIRNNVIFIKILPEEKREQLESYCKAPHIYNEIRKRITGRIYDNGLEDELCHYIAGVVNSVVSSVMIMEVE